MDANPPVVTVVPLTRTRREVPTHVEIEPGESGLRQTSYAKCEDFRAISPERLSALVGSAAAAELARVGEIVRRLLALEECRVATSGG